MSTDGAKWLHERVLSARFLLWVVAAIVTGSGEDFALERFNLSFTDGWAGQVKAFVFIRIWAVLGLARDLLLGNAW